MVNRGRFSGGNTRGHAAENCHLMPPLCITLVAHLAGDCHVVADRAPADVNSATARARHLASLMYHLLKRRRRSHRHQFAALLFLN